MRHYQAIAIAAGATSLGLSAGAAAQDRPAFNDYIVQSVEKIARERAGGGYNINKAFTRDLRYGNETIKATGPTDTMCVAGVAEIIIEAINLYSAATHDQTVYAKLPASHWKRASLTTLRGNIFMVQGAGSRGTANALQRLGLGKELRFPELKRGDFVNLNRPDIPSMPGNQASGHAVVFWDFIHSNGNVDAAYRPDVVGFKYFSAQGKGKPDAGFAFRWAYFGPNCPVATPGKPRDCRVIKSTNPILLNVGRMYAPSEWRVTEAVARLTATTRSAFYAEAVTRGMSASLAAAEAQRQLGLERPIAKPDLLNGETTD